MAHAPASPNLARFDLVSIRIAVACAQHGSLSAAARSCNLALAAASRRVRELEEALGGALFERHARGLVLTPAGQIFTRHGLSLLQTVDRLGAELHDFHQGVARHVALCASSAAINQFLAPLLARYARDFPHVRVDLDEQVSEAVPVALRERRADLGIFVQGPDITGLETLPFRADKLHVLLPPGHKLAGSRNPIAFHDLLEEDWISLSAGAAVLKAQQQAAVAAGRTFKLRFQVRGFDAVCHLVHAGLGVAVLPQGAAQPTVRALRLVTRPLADAWSCRPLLVAMRAGQHDELVRALALFLSDASQTAKPARRKRQ